MLGAPKFVGTLFNRSLDISLDMPLDSHVEGRQFEDESPRRRYEKMGRAEEMMTV